MKVQDVPTEGVYISFVRSKNILARLIQFGMWLFQILQMKRYPTKSFNHTDLIIDGLLVGAQKEGIIASSVAHIYSKGQSIELYKVPIKDEEEFQKLWEFILETLGSKYEFSNFLYHAKKIFTGKWTTKNEDRFYCIEHTAEAMNILFEDFCPNPYQVNPVEFLEIVRSKLILAG